MSDSSIFTTARRAARRGTTKVKAVPVPVPMHRNKMSTSLLRDDFRDEIRARRTARLAANPVPVAAPSVPTNGVRGAVLVVVGLAIAMLCVWGAQHERQHIITTVLLSTIWWMQVWHGLPKGCGTYTWSQEAPSAT